MAPHGAVAIDMGASSARFAAGWIENEKIKTKVIEQIHHEPMNGKWQTCILKGLCDRAVEFAAQNFKTSTIGIDTWGVDHGFLDTNGDLIQDPVAYRDDSHVGVFDDMQRHRRRLFELTGIQHQPFNTLYQLIARKKERPDLTTSKWQLLPDLFGHFLTNLTNFESTQSSTTQLVGTDGAWSEEAFELAGWPVPEAQPSPPGRIIARMTQSVSLASVASHDTASAVCGLGTLTEHDLFLNMGTWSLFGTLLQEPLTSPTAEEGGWTNERAHDGRIRFLKNLPGFYVVNRLHEELRVQCPVSEWLAQAPTDFTNHFDYLHRSLYNPPSMVEAVSALLAEAPNSTDYWAALAQNSLVKCMAGQPSKLGELTYRQFERIRVAGGGSQSPRICQGIADATGLKVVSGPSEATILGNVGMQLVAADEVAPTQLAALVDSSIETRTYEPRGRH